MNINELMIGDWVYNSVFDRYETILSINGDRKEALTLNVKENIVSTITVTEGNLKAIPITKEILEEFGFVVSNGYAIYNLDEYKYMEYYFHENRFRVICEGIDEWENHAKVKDIVFKCYVDGIHELQHAMKLSKVDREINKTFMLYKG